VADIRVDLQDGLDKLLQQVKNEQVQQAAARAAKFAEEQFDRVRNANVKIEQQQIAYSAGPLLASALRVIPSIADGKYGSTAEELMSVQLRGSHSCTCHQIMSVWQRQVKFADS
jgi:hypothetical protein